MTVGFLVGCLVEYNNFQDYLNDKYDNKEEEEEIIDAQQADFDAF